MAQKYLLDNRKLGRMLLVETFNVTQIKKNKQKIQKKRTLLTVYVKQVIDKEIFTENENKEPVRSVIKKEEFIKWAEFEFSTVQHPKDRVMEMLSKIERPLNYIPDNELVEELARRELANLNTYPDQVLINEMKRRGLTEFANTFAVSKNATFGQKLIAKIKGHKKIPNAKLTFEETVQELKKRHLLVPDDFLYDEKYVTIDVLRNIIIERDKEAGIVFTPDKKEVLAADDPTLFEDSPPAPDSIDADKIQELLAR